MQINKIAFSALLVLFLSLSSCSDTYNDPVYLEDQQALSQIYKNRPRYSSLYYEGEFQVDGKVVDVFVLRVISKFGPFKAYSFYYLPANEIAFQSTLPRFTGKDALKLNNLLSYDHDDGEFSLYSSASRKSETVKANFTEKYSLREEKCINAKQSVAQNPTAFEHVKYAAEICFLAGSYQDSRLFTQQIKDNIDSFNYTTKGGMLHEYHTLMGRHMVREGNLEEAKQHLMLSIDLSPSAVMQSFGPNMSLALDLLLQGEKVTVLAYLNGCARFWEKEPIEIWKTKINDNKVPALDIHSWEKELDTFVYKVNDATLSGAQAAQLLPGSTVTGNYDYKGWDFKFNFYFQPDGEGIYGDYYGQGQTTWELRDDGCLLTKVRWNSHSGCLYIEQAKDGSFALHPGVYAEQTPIAILAGQHDYSKPECFRDYQDKQYSLALISCTAAAESHNRRAQNLLGLMYEKYLGEEINYDKAIYWYERATDLGERHSPYNLAQLYRTGKGGTQDTEKAVEYYLLAAERGNPEGQFSLGVMYFEGSGTDVDMEKARFWWEKAKSNGVARADDALSRIP